MASSSTAAVATTSAAPAPAAAPSNTAHSANGSAAADAKADSKSSAAAGASAIGADVTWKNPNPTATTVNVDGKDLVPYYAIGSMMNITSMNLRDIFPYKSVPGELKGYELVFRGLNGMASIDAHETKSTHGVLHYITVEQMEALDKIEASYTRLWVDIHLYDANKTVAKGWVYQMDHKRFPSLTSGPSNPPSERYIDVITRGCKHYGVKQEFIDWLGSIKVVPRRAPKDYRTIPDPDGVFEKKTVTMAELKAMDGNSGRDLWVSINCKVMRFGGDLNTTQGQSTYAWAKSRLAGKENTVGLSRTLYEPLYPVCTRYCDMSPEHRAWCEDFYANNWTGVWKPVGRLSDMPADA